MALTHPTSLNGKKLGREGYLQRLVGSLIFGDNPPAWNKARSPSDEGWRFLQKFDTAFLNKQSADRPGFIDEFELPARNDNEKAGWPDWGVVWDDRLLLIELKTERASHRAGQLPHYQDLCRHHHPQATRDLVYLTPNMRQEKLSVAEGEVFHHVFLEDCKPLFQEVWGGVQTGVVHDILVEIIRTIDDSEAGKKPPWRSEKKTEEVQDSPKDGSDALHLAMMVQRDGLHRAVETDLEDPNALEDLFHITNDLLRGNPVVDGTKISHVKPWKWRPESKGSPMTECGKKHGYELRLSKYQKSPW